MKTLMLWRRTLDDNLFRARYSSLFPLPLGDNLKTPGLIYRGAAAYFDERDRSFRLNVTDIGPFPESPVTMNRNIQTSGVLCTLLDTGSRPYNVYTVWLAGTKHRAVSSCSCSACGSKCNQTISPASGTWRRTITKSPCRLGTEINFGMQIFWRYAGK